jgi:hypothetical protein
MTVPISPQMGLLLATVLFLVGCGVLAYRPDRWRLALAVLVPSSVLTVWLVFGPELRELVSTLL